MDADERAEKIRAEVAAARLPGVPDVPTGRPGSAEPGSVAPPLPPTSPQVLSTPPVPVASAPVGRSVPRPPSQPEVVAVGLGAAATLVGALVGAVILLGGMMSAGPAQQTAAAVTALAWVLLPYCATRALAEILRIWRSQRRAGWGLGSMDEDDVKFCAAGEHIIPAGSLQCPVCGAK